MPLVKNKHSKIWLLIPILLFIGHAYLFGAWIIDDAGISFAYARNFALGYGLVSQPGVVPIEGYSNFLWVIWLSVFFFFNLFDPVITPKILAILFIVPSFYLLWSKIGSEKYYKTLLFAFIFIATNTSFVVWSVSGLENSLQIFLLSLLVLQANTNKITFRISLISAIIVTLIAITRPEGILFGLLYPLVVLARRAKHPFKHLFLYSSIITLLFGSFLLFRISYFNNIFPQTFHGKTTELSIIRNLAYILTLHPIVLTKFSELMNSMVPFIGFLLFTLISIYSGWLFLHKKMSQELFLMLSVSAISLLIYLWLPTDWMGEYRFATPFFFFFYLFTALLLHDLYERSSHPIRKIGSSLLIMGIILLSLPSFYNRSVSFANAPTTPFALVSERNAFKFNQYALELDVESGSLLAADIGGALYYSDLQIYDLAGLTNPQIADTIINDKVFFHNYIFDEIKPTFITVTASWTYLAQLDNAPRFREDYVPICESIDSYVQEMYGKEMYSGDYVRKEIAGPQLSVQKCAFSN